MDSLRTRIAAAMYRHAVERLEIDGIKMWDQLPESVRACWYPAADAVIRELGWREEKAVKNSAFKPPLINTYATPEAAVDDIDRAPPHVKQDLRLVHRYVTEWENNE